MLNVALLQDCHAPVAMLRLPEQTIAKIQRKARHGSGRARFASLWRSGAGSDDFSLPIPLCKEHEAFRQGRLGRLLRRAPLPSTVAEHILWI